MENLSETIETMRVEANSRLDSRCKVKWGQFMTPISIASFMASLFSPEKFSSDIRLLDPGSGIGVLTAAFLERWGSECGGISIDSYEIDEAMRAYQFRVRQLLMDTYVRRGLDLNWEILGEDFISSASTMVPETCSLLGDSYPEYTHCIMNPPYLKMSNHCRDHRILRSLGVETSNYYAAFMVLALKRLQRGGELAAIVPRSFCNGVYFKSFRHFLLQTAAIRKIHLFESRKNAFQDDHVLQENIILFLEKGAGNENVVISTSTDQTFQDLQTRVVPFSRIVSEEDSEQIIHIPAAPPESAGRWESLLDSTLEDLGIQVSTGPIVDFRLRDYLCNSPLGGTVPLLYPCHFIHRETEWPQTGKKPNAIRLTQETRKWLFPCGYYTVLRRFSTKEEKRRLVASTVEPEKFSEFSPCEMLGFENHLNVFHENRRGLSRELAYGLTAFLNSSYIDSHFREFSGHTQVNASDVRRFRYPSRERLMDLGKWFANHSGMEQSVLDEQVLQILGDSNEW